jgi:hypothetical protein
MIMDSMRLTVLVTVINPGAIIAGGCFKIILNKNIGYNFFSPPSLLLRRKTGVNSSEIPPNKFDDEYFPYPAEMKFRITDYQSVRHVLFSVAQIINLCVIFWFP